MANMLKQTEGVVILMHFWIMYTVKLYTPTPAQHGGAAPGTNFGVERLCCSARLALALDTNYFAAIFPESRKLVKALQQLQHQQGSPA